MCRFLIWGTGKNALSYGIYLEKIKLTNLEVIGFIDNDKRKRGEQFRGKNIFMPEEIDSLDYDYIDIWSSKYFDEIYHEAVNKYHVSPDRIRDIFFPYKQKLEDKYVGTNDAEIRDFLKLMWRQHGIDVFYYESTEKEEEWNELFFDEKAQLPYIFFEGKRMYLKRDFPYVERENGKKYIGNMYKEQDANSPHKYEGQDIVVEEGDILVDAGACEGNFSLYNIDKVQKVYLIECNKEWMEALHYTFEPYKDKVVFCEKFLSNTDSERTIRLDTLVKEPVDFIKMDIEGEEIRALEGGKRLLSESKGMKCAICSYHRHGDEEKIKEDLYSMGFVASTSNGYMLFLGDDAVIKNPELRRGVVRGKKAE